jgi:uncharacterized ferredoxin-like protein
MIEDSRTAETTAVLNVARQICAAARTAPKACGKDQLSSCILTEGNKDKLAAEMDRLAKVLDRPFFGRDANNVRASQAVVLLGVTLEQRGLNEACKLCRNENCNECAEKNGVCIFAPMDLGIALGSAVSIAADNRMDSRILFSAGQAARSLNILPKEVGIIMAIPLSVSAKSPFFDRK